MTDQIEEITNDVNKSNIEHAINITTIITLLINKGVFTNEEFLEQRLMSSSLVDQIWAEKRDNKSRPSE